MLTPALVSALLTAAAVWQGASAAPSRRTTHEAPTLRVLAYNIRFDSLPDEITVQETVNSLSREIPSAPDPYYASATEELPWSTRRIHVAQDILFNNVDIFGGQEVLKRQVDDLEYLLGDDYTRIGIGRNGGDESEFSPIFFKNSAATLESWDTFWLSTTPFEPSYYPGTTNRRICTAARFTHPTTKKPFVVLNTHLDHEINEQRRYGLSLILHRAKYEAIKSGGSAPIILTGDFNSPTSGPNGGGYQIITGELEPVPDLNATFLEKYSWTPEEEARAGFTADDFVMRDLLGEAPPVARSGNWATFTFWAAPGNSTRFSRIDYVMAGSNGGWTAKAFHVGDTLHDDGVWASDHRPVYADLTLTN